MTAILFLAVLAVLIFVHELGHFLFARWNGIRVDEFKIGFGPKILEWGKGETKYGLNLVPFGGFVKIHGENPDEDSMNGPDKSRSFSNKNRWQQVSVLVAGVLFNFLFAFILYVFVFATGVTAAHEGFETYESAFKNDRVMITYVQPGSPAEKAGIVIGDVIQSVAGAAASEVEGVQNAINSTKGTSIKLGILHSNKEAKNVEVLPVTGLVDGRYAIGIAMQKAGDLRLPIYSAVYEGARYTLIMMRDTALGLYTFFANIFRGQANFSDVAGPVGIAGIVGNAAEMGVTYLLMVTAIISINLGIINLVPFPALDGGRMLMVAIEGVFRRRIPVKFANTLNTVGFVFLMALMVFVTYKDVAKLL